MPNSAPSERKGEAYANSGHKEANLVGGLLIKIWSIIFQKYQGLKGWNSSSTFLFIYNSGHKEANMVDGLLIKIWSMIFQKYQSLKGWNSSSIFYLFIYNDSCPYWCIR